MKRWVAVLVAFVFGLLSTMAIAHLASAPQPSLVPCSKLQCTSWPNMAPSCKCLD